MASAPNVARVDPDGTVVGARAGKAMITGASGSAAVTVPVVGRLPRTRFTTEEVWIHPSG